MLPTLDPFALLTVVLAAEQDVALDAEDHLAVSRPNLTEHLRKRPVTLPRPKSWSVPAPWALLHEFVLNVEWIEEMHNQAKANQVKLILKTSPGVAFQLELAPLEALPIAAAVQARFTFIWDKLEVVEIILPTAVAYSRPLRPEVVTFTGLLEKNKHKWW